MTDTAVDINSFFGLTSPLVLAVDDQVEQLDKVRRGLDSLNMPCLAIPYNEEDFAERFPEPFPGVRVLFLDINLTAATGNVDSKIKAGLLANVINRLVSPGPFVLVFWTNFPQDVDEIMGLLLEVERFPDLPLPLSVHSMDKNLVTGLTQAPDGDREIERVRNEIKGFLGACPLPALIEWETRVATAAAQSLASLYTLANNPGDRNTDNLRSHLACLLTKIAYGALGDSAADKSAEAAEAGLFPLLLDGLNNLAIRENYQSAWNDVLRICQKDAEPQELKMPSHVSKETLHSHYLIQQDIRGSGKSDRGVWVPLTETEETGSAIESLLGLTRTELLEDFLKTNIPQNEQETIRSSCKIGLVECSAECDHAHSKLSVFRYVVCVLIPKKYEKYTFNSKQPNDAILSLPDLMINDESYKVRIHIKYTLGLPSTSNFLGGPQFRFRRDVANTIAFKCSQHWTRPGFISFK